jgi:hypothetical protein
MIPRLLAMAVFPILLYAQWPAYKTPHAPRLPNGQVDLNAPTPKAPGGHPDLSGIWSGGRVPGAPPPASNFAFATTGKSAGPRPFQDLPSLFPDGLPLQPWAAKLRAERLANNSKDHPDAHCLPIHPIQLHSHPQARKIVQTSSEVLIMYEANNGLRQIFTDGRPLPNNDPDPWWFGYSIGHWEGDTLVAESTGFRDNSWLDEQGTPASSALKLSERFRRVNYGTLDIGITVDDPKTFTRPWSFTLQQRLMPDTDLIEFVCLENNTSLKHLVGK